MIKYNLYKKKSSGRIRAFLMGAILMGAVQIAFDIKTPVRASVPPETPVTLQCDEDTIIKAHYIEVIDSMDLDYVPSVAAPNRKPLRLGDLK